MSGWAVLRTLEVAQLPDDHALEQELATLFLTKFCHETPYPILSRGPKSKVAWEDFCFLETFACELDPSSWSKKLRAYKASSFTSTAHSFLICEVGVMIIPDSSIFFVCMPKLHVYKCE